MAVLDRAGLAGWRASLASGGEGKAVLEVGCGTGRTLALHPAGGIVVAIDPDALLLDAARRRAPGALLVQARAEALPFRDGAFDTVVSSLVFCSVDDPAKGLAEVARVLRPEGSLRMLEHVAPESRCGRWWARRLQPAWTALAGGCHPDRDTEGAVLAAGFRVDSRSRRALGVLRRFDARRPEGRRPRQGS
jgi:ubiquinone/menaquinone biosynthesis C-methylase UbiE